VFPLVQIQKRFEFSAPRVILAQMRKRNALTQGAPQGMPGQLKRSLEFVAALAEKKHPFSPGFPQAGERLPNDSEQRWPSPGQFGARGIHREQ